MFVGKTSLDFSWSSDTVMFILVPVDIGNIFIRKPAILSESFHERAEGGKKAVKQLDLGLLFRLRTKIDCESSKVVLRIVKHS